MARCTCSNPCTCYFEHDGDRPNTSYTQPFQYGRYNTRRSGTGSSFDPYIIEFIDSEEYRVESAQAITTANFVINSSTFFDTLPAHSMIIQYETPYEIFVAFDATDVFAPVLVPSYPRFWMASAQATFVYGGSTAGSRGIWFTWWPGATDAEIYPSGSEAFIAGTSTAASVAEDTTVSCSGFSPVLDRIANPFTQGGIFFLKLQQSSGSTMTVRNVRFTIVAF